MRIIYKIEYYTSLNGWNKKINFNIIVIRILYNDEIIYIEEYKIKFFIEFNLKVSTYELLNYIAERDEFVANILKKCPLIELKIF